jgi:hypothetical protein
MICLIGHGSAWLAGEPVGVGGLEERNTTFRYGRAVSFSFEPPRGEPASASTVATWLSQLAERDIERLWLATDLPGRRSWGLLATGGRRQERSQPTSTVVDPDAPDGRRSRFDYTGVPARRIAVATPPVAAAQEELLAALADARTFAAEHDLTFWADLSRAPKRSQPRRHRFRGFTPTCCLSTHTRQLPDACWRSRRAHGCSAAWNLGATYRQPRPTRNATTPWRTDSTKRCGSRSSRASTRHPTRVLTCSKHEATRHSAWRSRVISAVPECWFRRGAPVG